MALTPAQKQKAYRDRKRAVPITMMAEVEQVAARLLRAELAAITDRRADELTAARHAQRVAEQAAAAAQEAARRAEEALRQQGIDGGSLHPSGRPWMANEAHGPRDPSTPRAMQEAARRAVLQAAVDSFDRTGALKPSESVQHRRPGSAPGRIRYDWHRDY